MKKYKDNLEDCMKCGGDACYTTELNANAKPNWVLVVSNNAIITPATAGPTNWARLNNEALIPNADGRSSRGTKFGGIDKRTGVQKPSTTPQKIISPSKIQIFVNPRNVSAASTAETAIKPS